MLIKKFLYAIIFLTLSSLMTFLRAEVFIQDDINSMAVQTLPIELTKSWQISAIHLNNAWLSSSGLHIKVGVIDTGIFNHAEFSGRLLNGYDYVRNRTISANTNSDDNGHGSHVAGIIAANSNSGSVVGVAPLADLIPIKVLNSRGSGTLVNVNKGLNYSLTAGARVINLSLGWNGSGDVSVANQLKANVQSPLITNGQIIVIAAGNSSLANPSWPARYAKETWANGQIIAVGAVDNRNVLASFSNKAGDTANYYIVAPGVNIYSTTNKNNNYATLSGTSMATPVVSGAAALLASYWPSLRAETIVNILLTTTDDLGAPGTDIIYGRGLLNVDRALQPSNASGAPIVITSTGTSFPLSVNTQSVPLAYGNALAQANISIAALDDYGRDYQYNLSSLYAGRVQPIQLASVFQGMDQRIKAIEGFSSDGKYRMVQINPTLENDMAQFNLKSQSATLVSAAYLKNFGEGHQLAMGLSTSTNFFTGFSDTPFERQYFLSNKTFDNPYLGFNNTTNFLGYGFQLSESIAVKSVLTTSYNSSSNLAALNRNGLENEPINYITPKNNAFYVEISKKWNEAKISIASGMSTEQASLLGGSPGSVFAVDGQSNTRFFNSSITKKITENTWVAGSYNLGYTTISGQKNSLVDGLQDLRSDSWSMGIVKTKNFNDADQIGFAISQPMVVSGGTMDLTIPLGLNENGSMIFQHRAIDMKSSIVERNYELNYFTPLSEESTLSLSGLLRTNPGNIESSKVDGIIAARIAKYF